MEKTLFWFERSAKRRNKNCIITLTKFYSQGKIVPKNNKKVIEICLLAIKLKRKVKTMEKQLKEILVLGEEEWTPKLNIYWPFVDKEISQKQIFCLLLLSKVRSHSPSKTVSLVLLKGITMVIIKYLCHFRQLKN